MAYAPRRRAGKEVQAFATAFMQGMKLFSDDDRRSRRSRDPYSDENLEKVDERLGSTSALGKLFGMGKDELTGIDRGIAASGARRDIAIARGDAPRIKQYTEEGIYLRRLRGDDGGGSKPAGAIPSAKPKSAPTTTTPPPSATTTPPPPPNEQSDAALRQGEATSGAIRDLQRNNPELFQRQSYDPNSADSQEAAKPEFTEAVLEDNQPDFSSSSLFDMGVEVARGGLIPALHAARGMSVPSRTGSTYGDEDFGFVPEESGNEGFIPEGSDNDGFFPEGRSNEGSGAIPAREPTSPLPPGTPSIDRETYDEGRVANLGLSRDPEELAAAAVPAVKAGLNRIQAELTPSGAIPAQDPAYQEKLQKFARGQGRMSDEEIRQLDAMIDPDGELPDASKSAARLAAIYKFYEDRGDPETASTAAARVILYNKFAAQTRGAMALQAFNDGDLESGVRLLADAQNKDNPDGKTVRGSVNPDGTINFELGWDKLTGFEKTGGGRATKQDAIQLAQAAASGTLSLSELVGMQRAGEGRTKGATPTAAATNRAAAAASVEKFNAALGEVTTAAKAIAAARASNDPDAIKAADDALTAARTKAMSGAPSDNVRAQRERAVRAAIAQAISSGVPTTTSRAPTSVAERQAAAIEDEKAAILKEQAALEYYNRAGRGVNAFDIYEQEPGPIEAVRTKLQSRLADLGYRGAKDAPESEQLAEDRAKRFMMALEGGTDDKGKTVAGLLNEVPVDARGQKDPTKARPKLTSEQRDAYTDIFARLATKNDGVTPRTLASVVYDITNPAADEAGGRERRIGVDPKTGRVSFGGKVFYADQQSIVEMMQMRGKALKSMRAQEGLSVAKTRDKELADQRAIAAANANQPAIGGELRYQASEQVTNLDKQISSLREGLKNPNMPPRIRADQQNQIETLMRQRDTLSNRLRNN